MTGTLIRHYLASDMEAIEDLQRKYNQVYPEATFVPAGVYNSPSFAGGANIFCALPASGGDLLGYAPIFPQFLPAGIPDAVHTIWTEIKVDPTLTDGGAVKDRLYQHVLARCRELIASAPSAPVRLCFQYYTSETAPIAWAFEHGFTHQASVFLMRRDLSDALPVLPQPAGIQVHRWRMETEAEQRQFIQAHNQAFPLAPMALEHWQYFLGSPHWANGTNVAAFDGDNLAGSVSVFWDPAQEGPQRTGSTEYVFVLPAYRRRGIAAYLLREALAYLQEKDLQFAQLEVRATNRDALGVYTGLGYRVIQESVLLEKYIQP